MKSLMVFTSILVSFAAQAEMPETVLVHSGVQVLSASCGTSLEHKGHDVSTAGSTVIKTAEGQILKMELIISRFAIDEKKEARGLCDELKRAVQSGKKLDVIFQEGIDGGDLETKILEIKGVKVLRGMNPLSNG